MRLNWGAAGTKRYETGVDRGVLYPISESGVYDTAYAWNGLTTVTETPTGAEASSLYADNAKYLDIIAAEEFEATIEAYSYPVQFGKCDGTEDLMAGVSIGQQNRQVFGFAYRSLIGDDIAGTNKGYKIKLIYGCKASPSEKTNTTVNESPEAVTFSWEITTTPVPVTGFKPTASLTIDSTLVSAEALKAIEDILYGTADVGGRLPLPDEVKTIMAPTP